MAVAAGAVQALGNSAAGEQAKGNQEQRDLDSSLEKVSKLVASYARELKFSQDEETGIKVVKVVDSASGEVIRQMPSEEVLKIAQSLDKIVGLLFQERA